VLRKLFFRQCLFCQQNADGNSSAGDIVLPVRSLAETKKQKINPEAKPLPKLQTLTPALTPNPNTNPSTNP